MSIVDERTISRQIANTLAFLCTAAFDHVLAPRRLEVDHSYADGLWCHEAKVFDPDDEDFTIGEGDMRKVEAQVRTWIGDRNLPIIFSHLPREVVLERFKDRPNKLEIIRRVPWNPVGVIMIGTVWDYTCGEEYTQQKSLLKTFELQQIGKYGFVIRCPRVKRGLVPSLPPWSEVQEPKLFNLISKRRSWSRMINVRDIRDVNELTKSGEIKHHLWFAEALHDQQLVNLAQQLRDGFPARRVVMIAGPSSAGKTTFAKRLSVHLKVLGYGVQSIGLDNYYKDRPEDGSSIDPDDVSAFDTELLVRHIETLCADVDVPKRIFKFKLGKGFDSDKTLHLGKRDFIVIEGIHCLNPNLTKRIGVDRIFRIFVSCQSTLAIDSSHRISTSDVRLMRRITRDHKFRKFPVDDTLDIWESVREQEEHSIFPFQKEADYSFNSSLFYELPVIASHVKPLLAEYILLFGKHDATGKIRLAERLFTLLAFFAEIPDNLVPGISVLREFIGNSDFQY